MANNSSKSPFLEILAAVLGVVLVLVFLLVPHGAKGPSTGWSGASRGNIVR